MIPRTLMATAVLAAGLTLSAGTPVTSAALPAVEPLKSQIASETLVEKARYGYCRRWYRECRIRWGWGWRFRRCMRRHGC